LIDQYLIHPLIIKFQRQLRLWPCSHLSVTS